MNWENQGRGGWDIDHIIAMSKFDYKLEVSNNAKGCCTPTAMADILFRTCR